MADFIAKIDEWMEGTVWTTRCSNYFRAANGRVVTQWPRSARAFWGMTRRFRASDYALRPARVSNAHVEQSVRARSASRWSRRALDITERLDPALRHLAAARTDLSADVLGADP